MLSLVVPDQVRLRKRASSPLQEKTFAVFNLLTTARALSVLSASWWDRQKANDALSRGCAKTSCSSSRPASTRTGSRVKAAEVVISNY